MNTLPDEPAYYLHLGDTRIRAYSFIFINTAHYDDFDPHMFAQSMRIYHSLPYPYTWCVYAREHAVVVNMNDLRVHETRHRLPPTYQIPSHPDDRRSNSTYDDEVAIQEAVDGHMEDQLNESFLESLDFVACSGLTKKEISKNLRLTNYSKEEEEEEEGGEICVVCQVEFERNERLGVLQCNHTYHPICITRWLIRQNVCPLCKAEGLRV